MIVLDTNVVSEAMKPVPQSAERACLNDQAAETFFLSKVSWSNKASLVECLDVACFSRCHV